MDNRSLQYEYVTLNFIFYHLVEVIQSNPQHFNDANNMTCGRRLSDASMQSTVSGLIENISLSTINSCKLG